MGIPASTYAARGLQIRLTVNLFGEIGQSWGLVNGAIGTIVEVLFDTPEAADDKHALPTVIAHCEEYCGPAFCASHPKLVVLPPIQRDGDCSCKCSRRCLCFRVSEGTTVHATEGITVGAKRMVKRIGIDLGDQTVENRSPGIGLVANSRPETTNDFCYMNSVSIERLMVSSTGQKAASLKERMKGWTANQSKDAQALLRAGLYKPLLQWAEDHAWCEHGVLAPWRKHDAHVIAFDRAGGHDAAVNRRCAFN